MAYPHAAGFDEYLPHEITRLALMLRANVLARGYSAVRPALIERLIALVNGGVAPAVRGHGSKGLSDLGPMAQCVLTVTGMEDASAFYQGELMSARQALKRAGLEETFTLECKEVLSQINGSTMTQAIAVTTYLKLRPMLPTCLAMFGQERAQAIQETVDWIGEILERENNITCDNPLLFETDDGEYEAVMGCNCSNTQVGYAMDLLSAVIAELGKKAVGKNQFILWQRLATLAMQVSGDSIPPRAGRKTMWSSATLRRRKPRRACLYWSIFWRERHNLDSGMNKMNRIPFGERVLMFNRSRYTTTETLRLLYQVDVVHLDLVSYGPTAELPVSAPAAVRPVDAKKAIVELLGRNPNEGPRPPCRSARRPGGRCTRNRTGIRLIFCAVRTYPRSSLIESCLEG